MKAFKRVLDFFDTLHDGGKVYYFSDSVSGVSKQRISYYGDGVYEVGNKTSSFTVFAEDLADNLSRSPERFKW